MSASLNEALPLVDEIVRSLRRRHNVSADESEELLSRARLRLVEDEQAVLRRFAGGSTLRTYLTTVIHRLLLDLRRERWGKWRPSAAAQRMGPLGVRLEQLLRRDGRTLDEAWAMLSAGGPLPISREQAAEMAARLPVRRERRMDGEEALAGLGVPAAVTEARVLEREADARGRDVAARLARSVAELPPQDRLILRLRFQDGFTVAQIASALRLEAKPLYRRLERILAALRSRLETEGVHAREVSDLLEASAWEPPPILSREDARTRPSR